MAKVKIIIEGDIDKYGNILHSAVTFKCPARGKIVLKNGFMGAMNQIDRHNLIAVVFDLERLKPMQRDTRREVGQKLQQDWFDANTPGTSHT